ncbi:DUF1569 domain-containing protein [Gimesia fumaroli]|uniref:DUF1569 domain-containing protein n=1 Tax=Gimesia fumaroli TaxID=2527976 RepID=A0A518IGP7_9PLAN|nr:DUF1569 domain-containing protein [Gimesia fumaroli]QDV52262.1 hypothetical protein Enr17x_43220 [Gimesia fumaroli]
MAVKTKKIQGRRSVHYNSLDDLLADAEQMANSNVHTIGNWSLGQILMHLAISQNASIDGFGFCFPAPMRLIVRLFMKRKFLSKGIPPGLNAPARMTPEETSIEEGLAALEAAIKRQQLEARNADHPAFGMLSPEEWDRFHLRHAEMHMSFVVPD